MKSILCLLNSFLISVFCFSQAGSLDETFGDNGKVYTDRLGSCYAAALQPDGKILVGGGGSCSLIRYLPDGTLDASFGDKGFTSVNGLSAIKAIKVSEDGKIITGGTANLEIAAARFMHDGRLDSSFGNNGTVAFYLGAADAIFAMAVQADGKIILGGWIKYEFEGSYYMLMTRLNIDGSIDSRFGQNGRVVNLSGAQINCLALQDDGKIIAGGQLLPTGHGTNDMFSTSRYNIDGSLDSSFGTNGTTLTDIDHGIDVPYSLSILNDGKILVAGKAHDTGRGYSYMTVVKYNIDGTLDENFGDTGISKIIFQQASSYATGLLVQQDGKLVLTGSAYPLTGINNFALGRLNGDGTIDSSFGINGTVVSDFGGSEFEHASVLQPDGKVILAGEEHQHYRFLIARYNNDAVMPLHFTYFNASPTNNGGIALNWQTVQENNNAYFAVERSGDSRFRGNDVSGGDEIKGINSKGNSSQAQTYSYTDNTPLQGTNFYRLKQVDKDGKFSYSQIVSATVQNGLTVVLYPNPVKDVLNIKGLDATMSYELLIMNAKGNLVTQTKINNLSSYKWNLRSLSKGVYYLNIVANQNSTTVKFVKE